MYKVIPNPEYAQAEYEPAVVYVDGRTEVLPGAPRYATAEDGIEHKNPIWSHITVESNEP